MPIALITGISGQTGSYLADQLAGLNWEVHGIEQNHSANFSESRHETHLGSVINWDFVSSVLQNVKPTHVFNLAAVSSVAESWNSPRSISSVNALGVANFLEAISTLAPETRFVQASSAEIFGSPQESPQNELTYIQPRNPYGTSKAFSHFLVQNFRDSGLYASNGILYNHESPRRPPRFVSRKITRAVSQIKLGQINKLSLGNLGAIRDWGWAPDYADALLRIGLADKPDDYVIATGISHSIREFLAAAFEAVEIENWSDFVETDEGMFRTNDVSVQEGDSSKIRSELGWKPTKNFHEIIEAMISHDMAELSK